MSKKERQDKQAPSMKGQRTGSESAAGSNRAAQRHQKESQVAQLSAANVEESPFMDRGDSAGGAGESLPEGSDAASGQQVPARGALDSQYGTDSSRKVPSEHSPARSPEGGRASSGGSGSSPAGKPQGTPDPGSSEKSKSTGAEPDTMSGPRPGGRS